MEDFKFDLDLSSKVFNCDIEELRIHIINESTAISKLFSQTNINSANLCVRLFNLSKLFEEVVMVSFGTDYYDYYQYCERLFGLSKKTVQHYLQVYRKFVCSGAGTDYKFTTAFEDFNISKLCELCTVSDRQLLTDLANHKLSSKMSFKQIRAYVKALKGDVNKENQVLEESDNEEINEDEIPMAYDPSKHYEDKYFMGLAKSQLVNNIITLQEHCEKLQEKIKELKKKK